jgi:hypothetical protein
VAERRCTFKCGDWNCGSYQFNLYKADIDQGDLCDVHYWQTKAQRKWVGLTDHQQEQMYQMTDNIVDCRTCYFQGIADAEAAHGIKEKNT